MDDVILVSIGRQFCEFITQRENLIRANMQLKSQLEAAQKELADLKAKEPKKKE